MKLEFLFPELCTLYGDPANVMHLKKCIAELEIIRTSLKQSPYFTDSRPDIVYMGSMTERSQEYAAGALMSHRDRIISLIEDGVMFLITGNACELFGQYIDTGLGNKLKMLEIFDVYAVRCMSKRFNSLYLGAYDETPVVGFKSQFSQMYGDAPELFHTVRGPGRNPEIFEEGICEHNFMATYVLGPLLLLNPPFTRSLLALLGRADVAIPYEDVAMDCYAQRLLEFTNPRTGFTY